MARLLLIGLMLSVGCSSRSANESDPVKSSKSLVKLDYSFGQMLNAIASAQQELNERFKPTSSGQRYAIETKMTEWIEGEFVGKIVTWNCQVVTIRKEFLGEQLLCYVTPELSENEMQAHVEDPSLMSVSFDVTADEALRLNKNDTIKLTACVESCSLDGNVVALDDVAWVVYTTDAKFEP
jgi:hypothetical protein